ncbi:hypothetical protein HAD_02855 [Hyphomonas adhaerens MHS-3]|uniref:Uncharacterized protein n=1 Tax=Hyphomonas adhaerens MHS-3 TaxID=1280949 RepID=A0A069E3Y3_9PROT|nr:hypothetical protein [Hyphomonas adhaerens]KCZ84584.1 hypothetical protein HAD_02855 [Hyphomonas adhaerens MHS-3]
MNLFREWLRQQERPQWDLLPLTHITKAYSAQKIALAEKLVPTRCHVFEKDILYSFYGRAAYKVHGDGAVKLEGACPVCFVLNGELLAKAAAVHPFDTGAYSSRLYKHVFADELEVKDFEISGDTGIPNALVRKFFQDQESYFVGDTSKIPSPEEVCSVEHLTVRAYHELVTSKGRNEPDDRVYSVEVAFGDEIEFQRGSLLAVIVPHTLWDANAKATYFKKLEELGAMIVPYEFFPGKDPSYYQALLEGQLRELFRALGYFDEKS